MSTVKYLFLLAVVISVSGRNVFDEQQYSKVYKSHQEEHFRKKTFYNNKLYIIEHNSLYELGQVSYELGLNEFSDLRHSEFIERMNGGSNTSIANINQFKSEAATYIVPDSDVVAPSSVDWSARGAVTPIKNHKQCGSCWAFSTNGALEGQHFRKTGRLLSLSEQNLVDCTRSYGTYGCNGGWMSSAFKYIIKNGGIETEQSYPYEARDANCRYNSKENSGATVKSFVNIRTGDEDALKMAVATTGPIAIVLDASLRTFSSYKGGIYYDRQCDPTKLNHAVLAIGYGTTANGQDYWTVKNSWGTSWGQNGYIFVARNKGNHCGIASAGIFPQV